ncbi:sulfurtransferase [Rhabdaerophilum sp. SD176]|uniref:sulfurtransferase n=1 Tax=Rhabdaerophilum sp. SD176 TaxID=2983548 RepID=UPI0024DF78D8|nr:sulfurtransferase [Rhabdaerophilum sp. SD176]
MTGLSGLVSAEALEALAGKPETVLLDIRLPADGGRAAFEEAHIPGAVFSDYAADGWRQRVGQVPGLLPEADHLARLFGALGIAPGSQIILIPLGASANDFAAAARACWTLRLAGHAGVAILDGGTRGWQAAGKPVESGPGATIKACAPYPIRWKPGLRALAEDVIEALDQGSPLVDARNASYFAGREKAPEARIAGHIPGARSRDYTSLFDPGTGRLLPRAALDAAFAEIHGQPVIHYCNTGHTAALNWFVLSEILGETARLYDGSMTEWTQDPARPVATA